MELRLIGKVFLHIVGWPIVMNHEKGSELQHWTDSIDRRRVNENRNSNIQTLKSTTNFMIKNKLIYLRIDYVFDFDTHHIVYSNE